MSSYEPYPSEAPASASPPSPPVAPSPTARPLLVRSRRDRKIAGVCGGFAAYTGYDANLIRLVLVAVTVLGFGTTVIVYLAGWLLMPEGE